VEVYSWWTGPGEEDGLNAMVSEFKRENPSRQLRQRHRLRRRRLQRQGDLASRLLANDPPDSYQRHAGLELEDDVRSGKVADLTSLYDEEGWRKVFPPGLLDSITIEGKIYSVPVNIHRANLIWYNPKTLRALGIDGPPKTWSEFLSQAGIIKKAGKTPIAVGPQWTQKHLLETVLLGELGADGYEGLWNGKTSWRSDEVDHGAGDLHPGAGELRRLVGGRGLAATTGPGDERIRVYAVMGDWVYSYLALTQKLRWQVDYNVAASPGSNGVFSFLSDAFTLPVGSRTRTWPASGSSSAAPGSGRTCSTPRRARSPPAPTRTPRSTRSTSPGTWTSGRDPKTRIVGSLTHGVVANNAWNAEIDTALGFLVQDGDIAKFANTVADKYVETQ
jgi:glucose/mannose transport system substrate-binding protein